MILLTGSFASREDHIQVDLGSTGQVRALAHFKSTHGIVHPLPQRLLFFLITFFDAAHNFAAVGHVLHYTNITPKQNRVGKMFLVHAISAAYVG